MPTEATVYRILLTMADDVEEERNTARDVIIDWNSTTGRKQDIHLEPVSAAHVDLERPDLDEEIDVVLGTFWTTVDYEVSGNTNLADVVRRLSIDGNVPAMIGFSEQNIPTSRLISEQYARLEAFRDDCRETGYFTYATLEEYDVQLQQSLSRTMDGILSSSADRFLDADEHDGPSEYDVDVDHERLQLSAAVHREQDERNIERVVEHFEQVGIEPPYRVLDAGCGYGTVTKSRFGDDDRFEVLAIDQSRNALEVAKDRYAASNVEYRWLDVNNLTDVDFGAFDLVFASYLFHHIANQESVLSLLWENVRDGGCLLIRSCEDGQHMHYPPDEDMDWLVEVTDEIPGSSDRTHGRRLPTHLKRLSPEPEDVWLDLENYHTVGRSSSERRDYWTVFHSNRLHYAKVRAERDNASIEEKRLYQKMAEQMDALEDKIIGNEHVFDVKSVPLVGATKFSE